MERAQVSRLRIPKLVRWGAVVAAIGIVLLAAHSLSTPATAQTGIDYDTDNDGLIEVANLNQLNAIRWNLTGDGSPEINLITYAAAYPDAMLSPLMGCPSGCIGYELSDDLDFDGSEWASGPGWTPIGSGSSSFDATFDGGGFEIENLFINVADHFWGRAVWAHGYRERDSQRRPGGRGRHR